MKACQRDLRVYLIEYLVPLFCLFSAKPRLTLYDPMSCSTPGFPVLHYLLKFAQTHVHLVGDAF